MKGMNKMKMFYEAPMANLSDEEILEKQKIRELVEYDRYCYDYKLKEEQCKLWHEDATLLVTWFKGTFQEYINSSPVKNPAPLEERVLESHHHRVNDTIVWLNGNKAIAEVLCFLNFRSKIAGEWMDLQCWVRFHYRLEKRGGKWGILYFEGIYEKDRLDPVFQDCEWKIPRQEVMKHRPINWYMSVRGEYLGAAENPDSWAGWDRPETVQRLYDESSVWFGLDEQKEVAE